MKNLLIAVGVFIILAVGILLWLAGSVGPETAPQDIQSIDLPDTYEK